MHVIHIHKCDFVLAVFYLKKKILEVRIAFYLKGLSLFTLCGCMLTFYTLKLLETNVFYVLSKNLKRNAFDYLQFNRNAKFRNIEVKDFYFHNVTNLMWLVQVNRNLIKQFFELFSSFLRNCSCILRALKSRKCIFLAKTKNLNKALKSHFWDELNMRLDFWNFNFWCLFH